MASQPTPQPGPVPGVIYGGDWGPFQPAPAPAPSPVPTGDGGISYDSGAAARQAAAQAEAVRQAAIVAQIATAQQGIESSGRLGATTYGDTYEKNVNDFLRTTEQGQQSINSGRTSNQLNLRRSMQNVTNDVRQGLRSGGVSLGNMNALDSGAAEALARAWARSGNKQVAGARNQAALKAGELDLTQANLGRERDDTARSLDLWRATEGSRVNDDLQTRLATLEAESAAQGVAGRVDMGIRNRIIDAAIARLNEIDAMRQQRLAAARPLTADEVMAAAIRMDQEGAAANPFATEGPSVTTPEGAPLSQLPLFTRKTDEDPLIPLARRDETLVT